MDSLAASLTGTPQRSKKGPTSRPTAREAHQPLVAFLVVGFRALVGGE